MRPSDAGWTVAVLLAGIWVLVLSGCSTAIDTSRRNLVSVGAGWGRLNADNPPPADMEIEDSERKLDFANAFAFDGTYARRLTGPRAPLGLFVEGVVQWVPPSRVEGPDAERSCEVGWLLAGGGLRIQSPSVDGISLSADGGYGLLRASQSGCSGNAAPPGSPAAATVVSPFAGFTIEFGLGPKMAWSIGIRVTRVPLDRLGLGERRWAGAGSARVLIAF